jgi:CRP-like cAMP-binding protein
MPKDTSFIDRFQNNINKKYFFKGSTIFNQDDEFKTFYIIHSGTVRMSICFNRQFFCSLDFDVLMGKHIKDRFTSNRFFEVEGNYQEKENFVVVDLENGEILGGIEFSKGMKNYIFTAQCITDVILYEINLKFFDNILSYWSFQRFYEKISQQFDYFIDRIKLINDFKKEKEKIDDYSFDQNKFMQTYRRGYPLSEKKDEYLSKFTKHFKFDKHFKSKELHLQNTRYYNKEKSQNENMNYNQNGKMPFIINLPSKKKKKKIKKVRKLVKSKTMMNIKFENSKLEEKIKEINLKQNLEEIKELKEHEQNNEIEEQKNITQNENETIYKQIKVNESENKNNLKDESIQVIKKFRHFNSSMIINSKNIKRNSNINNFINNNSSNNSIILRKKRLNSCRIDNDSKTLIKHNLYQKLIYLNSKNKNDKNRLILRKIFQFINDENEAKLKKNSKKNINGRNKNINFKQNSGGNSRKNLSEKMKNFSSGIQVYLSFNKKSSPLKLEKRNLSQPKINEKKLIFPIGIQEMNIDKYTNINDLLPNLPSFINNNYIRNELKIKNKNNINAIILLQNYSKLKNKKLKILK